MTELTVLMDGIYFGEGPRWRDGYLWLSDFYAHEVLKVDPQGNRSHVATVPEQPSGLGWLPDGSMLIVSMKNRKLMRLADGDLSEYADLSSVANWHCNDMVVSADGYAYVGNFGYDHYNEPDEVPANLVRVDPDRSIHLADGGLRFPNGSVITPDGKTLVIAGGVAANTALREKLTGLCALVGFRCVVPPPALCTDNGAMIAWAGVERLRLGLTNDLDFAPRPRWPLAELEGVSP